MNILKRLLCISFLIVTIGTSVFYADSAQAQDGDYLQLNGFSPFYCRYLANGKTEIATKSATGKYKKLSFDKAKDQSGKRKAALRNYQKQLAGLKSNLEKQRLEIEFGPGQLSEKEKKLILNYANGLKEEPLDVSDIRDTIAGLEEWLNNLQTNLEFQNLERSQIKDCEKRKLPPVGSFEITYELLITSDGSSISPWYGVGVVFMKGPRALFPGSAGNAICLTFQSGLKRLVAFNTDPTGAVDSQLSYASNHPLVVNGETAKLLPRDAKNITNELGYAPAIFSFTNSRSTRASVEDSLKAALPAVMNTWGSSALAKRANFDRKLNKYVCPE